MDFIKNQGIKTFILGSKPGEGNYIIYYLDKNEELRELNVYLDGKEARLN
jgi:hypothetical protein